MSCNPPTWKKYKYKYKYNYIMHHVDKKNTLTYI